MLSIQVTQEHIKQGERKNPEKCALALALIENFPLSNPAQSHSVGRVDMLIFRKSQPITLQNTPQLELWITAFDEIGYADPFTLTLDFANLTAAYEELTL